MDCSPQAPLSMGILQARILERVAMSSSKGSSQCRDWIWVSHIAGGFFTIWATREAQEYWSGQLIPSPGELPIPGIKPGSPALQADSLPTELPGKPVLPQVQMIQRVVFSNSYHLYIVSILIKSLIFKTECLCTLAKQECINSLV